MSSSDLPLVVGDVVSQPGGPPMTVERVCGDLVHCVWFAGTKLIRDVFRSERMKRHA